MGVCTWFDLCAPVLRTARTLMVYSGGASGVATGCRPASLMIFVWFSFPVSRP
jgi:hypothetical protein